MLFQRYPLSRVDKLCCETYKQEFPKIFSILNRRKIASKWNFNFSFGTHTLHSIMNLWVNMGDDQHFQVNWAGINLEWNCTCGWVQYCSPIHLEVMLSSVEVFSFQGTSSNVMDVCLVKTSNSTPGWFAEQYKFGLCKKKTLPSIDEPIRCRQSIGFIG